MLEKAKKIIYTIPLEEVIDYYCYFTGYCPVENQEVYRDHLWAKLRGCIRRHRVNTVVMVESTFRAYNMIAWIETMNKKYKIIEGDD